MMVGMGRKLIWAVVGLLLFGAIRVPGAVITNGVISAELEEDVEVGLRLTSLYRNDSSFSFNNVPQDASQKSLWALVLHDPVNGSDEVIDAQSAESYEINWATDGTSVTATWYNVTAPVCQDVFNVTLTAYVNSGDQWVSWIVDVSRESGTSCSLDAVYYPRLFFEAPIEPSGSESLLEAQHRARVFIPRDLQEVVGVGPLDLFCAATPTYELAHPGAAQYMGWSYLAIDDPASSGYRELLFLAALDFSGYSKKFHHQWFAPVEGQPAYSWWVEAFPPFCGISAQGRDNWFEHQYPALTGILRSRGSAYWYTAAAAWRSLFENTTDKLKLPNNPDLGVANQPYWVMAHATTDSSVTGATVYQSYRDQDWRLRGVMEHAASGVPISEWQCYGENASFGNPDTPVAEHVDDGAPETSQQLENEGFTVVPYTYPGAVPKSSNWYNYYYGVDIPDAEALKRDGSPYGGDSDMMFDYAHPTFGSYWASHTAQEIADVMGSTGMYIDTVAGAGVLMSYHRDYHFGHGGNYWEQGKHPLIQHVRQVLLEKADQAGKPRENVMLCSEAPEDGLVGWLDLNEDGYIWPPALMRFYEAYLYSEPVKPSTDWIPPVWSAVYHEWTTVLQLAMPWHNVGLATHPLETGYEGMTPDEFIDLWAYVNSLYLVAGYRPEFNDFFKYADSPLVYSDDQGNLWVDTNKDPTGAGLEVAEFLRDMWSTMASSSALLYGRMEYPLEEDFTDPECETRTNPIYYCRKTNPDHSLAVYPYNVRPMYENGGYQDDIGSSPMPVPGVLTGVWSFNGAIDLVVSNWQGEAASHKAVLYKDQYFAAGEEFYLSTPEGNWFGPYGGGRGELVLHWNSNGSTGGSDIYFGEIPARSIQLLHMRLKLPGDSDGNRSVEPPDIAGIVAEIFDMDGFDAMNTAGGGHVGSPNDDANSDGMVDVSDVAWVIGEVSG